MSSDRPGFGFISGTDAPRYLQDSAVEGRAVRRMGPGAARDKSWDRFDSLVDAVGPAAVLRLMKTHGGRTIELPRSPGEDSVVVRLLGKHHGRVLASRLGGTSVYIPTIEAMDKETRQAFVDAYATGSGALPPLDPVVEAGA